MWWDSCVLRELLLIHPCQVRVSMSLTSNRSGIVDILQAHEVNEVILTIPQTSHPEVLDLVALCRRRGIAVSLVPQPYLLYLSKPELVDLGGLPLLQLKDAATGMPSNPIWKRVLDLALATCLLLLSLPVILVAAAILKAKKGADSVASCAAASTGNHSGSIV